MADGKNKDIVEEVFGRSKKADDRISALFACVKKPPQVSLDKGEESSSGSKESPAAKDVDTSGNKLFQSAKGTRYEFLSKRTIKYKELIHQVRKVVAAGLVVFLLVLLMGSNLRQHENDSIKTMQEKQYVDLSEIERLSEKQPLLNVHPENVSGKINKNSTTLDWQNVINWGCLLNEISATIPKTVQLSVLKSDNGPEMFLEGRALSADAVYNFVDALSTNSQVKSAELVKTGIGKLESQDLLTFSINCCLVSDTKMLGSVDGDYKNSGFDRIRLFTPKEAEKFLSRVRSVSEHSGCMVKSLLVSPKDAVFEDEKTNGRIIRKYAVLILLGGYQNILKAVEKLQNSSQGIWFDSVGIKQGSETGVLECSMGISVYVAGGAVERINRRTPSP